MIKAQASLPDDVDPNHPDSDAGNPISLDNSVKPEDWPEGKNWGALIIDVSRTPADITYPTDLKLLNEGRESTERIIDDLCNQHSDLRKHKPRYLRSKARAAFLNVANQKNPRHQRIRAALRLQLGYLRRNHDAIDTVTANGARLLGLNTHCWHKMLVIIDLYRQ
jgi:IS5 family transposase